MYDWYKIFNLTEFMALNLVSRTYTLNLQDIGQKDILVTRGNLVSIVYNDVMVSLDLLDENPFEFEGFAIIKNPATQDVYLGISVNEG